MSGPKMEELVSFVTTDIAGITRGRAVGLGDLQPALRRGVGWVPANISLTPFGEIASPNPFGSEGDLRLMPDPEACVRVAGLPGASPLQFFHSDITDLAGRPWECCVRSMLAAAVEDLRAETGLGVIAAFEHEFAILGTGWPEAPPFALSALRRADPFGPLLVALLREAGAEPETFLAEFGRDQFEIVCGPSTPVRAADRAVTIREVTRELARRLGWQATFAPKYDLATAGNGVHIHLSLVDAEGRPVTYDAARPGGLSARAGSFAAGIVRHMAAITALTAPSVLSYIRLRPHSWSAAWTTLGEKDREASLRICPVSERKGDDPSRAFNVEFRGADATASPHLSLAALIRAGLEGLREGLEPPPVVRGDAGEMSAAEREALGIRRLPESLWEALAAFERDPVAQGWFSPTFVDAYLGMKRKEIDLVADLDGQALCDRYVAIY